MKKLLFLWILLLVWSASPRSSEAAPFSYGHIRDDLEVSKDPSNWRAHVPYLPSFSVGLGFGFTPAYFAPTNAEAQPYISSGLSLGMGFGLANFGVGGYWSDLSFGLSWGLSKALTDNIGNSEYARLVYSRDIGISVGKSLFVERNTGIGVSLGLSFKIPTSLSSWQSTLITSIGTGLTLSKSFLEGRINVSYSFGANFNIYEQDSSRYNPTLQGLPYLNDRWGMNHSLGASITIIKNLFLSLGFSMSVGYSFADAYVNPDGPQVFGAENLTPADLASFPLNENNSYGLSIGLSYRFSRYLSISLGYSNGGQQFEWQYDNEGKRIFVIRNPFKLQNGSFSFGLRGSI